MEEPIKNKNITIKKPLWLKTPIAKGETYFKIKKSLRTRKLVTVCEEAKCPNISGCWNTGTATFMILGDTCTRACRFCHIKTGNPGGWTDPNEPLHVAQSVKEMNLKYLVLTMVDRDDLEDGGASHIQKVISAVKKLNPEVKIEILSGDFCGNEKTLQTLLSLDLQVFSHNIETVKRLSPRVRDARASYEKSLAVLSFMKKNKTKENFFTKSSLMLGLGESYEEIIEALRDLRKNNVDLVTLGQYMQPTKKHLSIKKWIDPQTFYKLKVEAKKMGFLGIASGPLVRSSYKAFEFFVDSQTKLDSIKEEALI